MIDISDPSLSSTVSCYLLHLWFTREPHNVRILLGPFRASACRGQAEGSPRSVTEPVVGVMDSMWDTYVDITYRVSSKV